MKNLHYQTNGCEEALAISLPSGRDRNNHCRYLAQSTIDIISRGLDANASQIDRWDKVREKIAHPTKGKNTKAAETKANLLENVFYPMIQNIESPIKSFNKEQLDAANNYREYQYYSINTPEEKVEDCFVRNGDWIIYKIGLGYKTYLYNVVNKKKYLVNDCGFGTKGKIGVLRLDDLTSSINPYRELQNLDKIFYEGDYYSYAKKQVKVELIDWQYEKFPLCLNTNNEAISPAECFAGTIIPEFLEVEKDWSFTATKVNPIDCNDKDRKLVGTIEEIGTKCRIPAFAFGLLFIPKENALLAEQLFKLKLNGLLSKLLLTPHSFEVEESGTTFCKINKDGTNLKTILSFPLDKLRIYDKALLERYQKTNSRVYFVKPSDFRLLFGNDLNPIDQETFKKFVTIFSKYERYDAQIPPAIQIASMLKDLGKSYKDIANILDKTDISTYRDYLLLRTQYLSCFEGAERAKQEKIYKIIPEKAKKFMYFRDRQITTYWGNQKFESATTQYNNLVNKYAYTNTHLKPICDDCNLIGCILELDEGGWVQYMHDELQEFCNAYKNELQEKGFANSVQRLKQYEYKSKDLSVIAPKEVKDLAVEGSTLHHCVGGFVDAVIRGSENVLFIRRNDNPTKPFFTMALDPAGNIEQVHGYRNSSLTKKAQKANFESSGQEVYNKTFDLIAFLKEWAKDKDGLVNISTIKERYGALVAHQRR